MRDLLRLVRRVLDRRTKATLVLASIGLVLVAALDMVAISLVYPLVTLTTGTTPDDAFVRVVMRGLGTSDTQVLLILLATLVVALFTIKSLAGIAFNWWLGGFTNRNRAWLSTRILRSYLNSPFGRVSRRSTSELMRTQQDAVNQFFLSGVYSLMTALANSATIVGIVAVLFIAAPLPTAALVAYFVITGALYSRFVRTAARRAGQAAMQSANKTWRTALTALGAIKEIQLRGAQDVFVDRYRTAVLEAAQAHRISGFLAGLPRHILEVLFIIAIGIAVVSTSLTGSGGSTGETVGLLGAFIAAGFRILPALNGLLGNISSIQASHEGTRLVAGELLNPPPPPLSAREGPSLNFQRTLKLSSVSFSYPDADKPVLTDINLEIARGSTVAFVGASGAGKTTLVDIILGFHSPTRGTVTVDGQNIFENLAAWRQQVAYVPQDVFIIDGTLEENIFFDKPHKDPDMHRSALDAAIAQADLESLVMGLPDGVATQLGERGSRLSGGQKQRVGLARAMYRAPDVLVLDEATSALDNVTEKRVTQVIHDLASAVTTLVVAHRLSTVKEADVIVLMTEGRIVAQGDFAYLRDSDERFAELVRLGDLR